MNKQRTPANARQSQTLAEDKLNATKSKPSALCADLLSGQDPADDLAQFYLSPAVQSALTVQAFHADSKARPEIITLIHALNEQVDSVSGGDLGQAETMLIAQAHSLDAIFGCLARRAAMNLGQCLGAFEAYLKLALRAQNQCRATAETLAMIKNPPNVSFVRQANIANGPQQVNNDVPRARVRVRARGK